MTDIFKHSALTGEAVIYSAHDGRQLWRFHEMIFERAFTLERAFRDAEKAAYMGGRKSVLDEIHRIPILQSFDGA